MELLVARNPNLDSSLPYLLWVRLEGGLVFGTKGTWPRTSALYCHAVGIDEWPAEPEIVERVALRACARRGPAIDVVGWAQCSGPCHQGEHGCRSGGGGQIGVQLGGGDVGVPEHRL